MNTKFRRHDPLTQRFAHTLSELQDDPYNWWEGHDPEFTPPKREAGYGWAWWTVMAVISALAVIVIVAGRPA
jgi:hypothetical protein